MTPESIASLQQLGGLFASTIGGWVFGLYMLQLYLGKQKELADVLKAQSDEAMRRAEEAERRADSVQQVLWDSTRAKMSVGIETQPVTPSGFAEAARRRAQETQS